MSALDLLISAAQEAGDEALRHFRNAPAQWDKPGGAGPVTEADLSVNRLLEARLMGAEPGYGWLSEESENDPARLKRSRVFVVDPIDGTRTFIEGGSSWSHSLALVEDGRTIAAVVYLPVPGKLYAAEAGKGATLNGQPIQASAAQDVSGAKVLATRPSMEPRHWPRGVPQLDRHHRPSLAYRLCLVAEGRFDAMFTFRPSWEWDVAAGALIVREADASATDQTGGPLIFNKPEPLVDGVLAAPAPLSRALADLRSPT